MNAELGAQETSDPMLGVTVAHFRVLAPLGRGGMGVVYRAEDVDLWREVALKVLPPHWAEDGDRRASFLREARSAAAVAHANVATVYEVGTAGTTSYIAMEIVRGPTLREELARGIDHRRALSIAIGVARGLGRAHEVGVIHSDLKPENVMIDPEGEPKILDFGLARALHAARDGAALGAPGEDRTITGTLGYMSPEQTRGEALDARSDVFALGILIFELFSGRRPFATDTAIESLVAVIRDDPPSLLDFDAPVPIAEIVHRCLARPPDARFPSAGAVRDALLAARAWIVPAAKRGEGAAEIALAPTLSIAAAATAAPALFGIAAGADAFLGRDREIDDALARLDAGARLLTLVGPGGIGKTRTAQEIARRVRERERRPVVAIALGSTRTADDALQAIADALGVPLVAGIDPVAALGVALHKRGRLLLVLDETEAIAQSLGEPLARCLASAPETIALVTSRVRLRAAGEELLDLGPLDPEVGAELFLERARAVRARLRTDEAARAIAVEISERLDGSPLAIELAAARAEVLAPAAILERLDDRLRLLSTASRTGRHASMRAVLDWSWSLLDAVQRSVIAQMSVFRGGASAEAVEAIVVPGDGGAYVIDVLQALHASSLLRVAEDEHGETRVSMYESVRTYAEERLRADPPDGTGWARACGRHAAWFAARARDAGALSARGVDASGHRWLMRERENVLACADRALASEGAELDDGAIALASLARALHLLGGAEAARERARALTARAAELAPVAAADLLSAYALLAIDATPGEARALATRAVELAVQVADPELSARARSALCWALYAMADYGAATVVARQSLAEATSRGEPHLVERALADLARARVRAEDLEEARGATEAAIASARGRGAERALPELEMILGFVYMQLGELEAAAVHERTALDGALAVGLDRVAALCSMNLGGSLHAIGRIDEARTLLASAIERLERRGELTSLGVAHTNAGFLEHEVGALLLARSHYDRAIAVLARIHDRRHRALVTAVRGALSAQEDRIEDAERDISAGEELARTLDERVCRVAVSLMRGHLELARARRTADDGERARLVTAVRGTIETVSTDGPDGSSLTRRSDLVRAAVRSLEWVLAAEHGTA